MIVDGLWRLIRELITRASVLRYSRAAEVPRMASTVFTLFNAFDVAPGATWNFEWKNLPDGKAYRVDAAPFEQSTLNTVAVEVTRVWRRTRQIQKSGGLGVDIHRDILGQVKNVGTSTTSFTLLLIVFT